MRWCRGAAGDIHMGETGGSPSERDAAFQWKIALLLLSPSCHHVQVVSETMTRVSGVPGWQLDLVGGARRGGGPGHDVDVLISHPAHPAFVERCWTLPATHPAFVGRCSASDSPSSSAGPGVRASQLLVASSSPPAASGGHDATSGADDSGIGRGRHQSAGVLPESLGRAAGSQEGRAYEVPLVEALFEELVASGDHLGIVIDLAHSCRSCSTCLSIALKCQTSLSSAYSAGRMLPRDNGWAIIQSGCMLRPSGPTVPGHLER